MNTTSTNTTFIYTDGSANFKTKQGGWAYVVTLDNKEVYHLNGFTEETTNNRMEMKAVLEALKYCSTHNTCNNFEIKSDSQYVVKGLNSWIDKWLTNNWKEGKVLNIDLWEELLEYRGAAKLSWVKGHNGDIWNERADKLCDYKKAVS